jgi:hypothetical protein
MMRKDDDEYEELVVNMELMMMIIKLPYDENSH